MSEPLTLPRSRATNVFSVAFSIIMMMDVRQGSPDGLALHAEKRRCGGQPSAVSAKRRAGCRLFKVKVSETEPKITKP